MRVFTGTVDSEFNHLRSLQHTGSLNDMQYSYLDGQGYAGGSLDDKRANAPLDYAVATGVPSIAADFEKQIYNNTSPSSFSDIFTFARASDATYVDADGLIKTATTNEPRYDYASGARRLLIEPTAATNLLLNSGTLSTQNVTVTAVPHTLHFTGTGTVTLSGTSTAGPLVGTGTGESNRVSLTFTPTAGTLTLTVTGTVTNAQLEAGSVPTSYIPTNGSSATRAAETLTIAAAKLPSYTTAVSFALSGEMTYADTDNSAELYFFKWSVDVSNELYVRLQTNGSRTGRVTFGQLVVGVGYFSGSSDGIYSPGTNVLFSIASRHGSTFINGAVDGTALTANTTPTAIADLSAVDLSLAYSGSPLRLKRFLMWNKDIGDTGIAEASA